MQSLSTEIDYRQRLYDAYIRSGQVQEVRTKEDIARQAPYLRNLIRQYFPNDRSSRILDLGCGPGALLFYARLAGYSVLRGVDTSPEQVECARSLGLECVQLGDAFKTIQEQASNSLDLIVILDVLEHFEKQEIIHFFDLAYRALSPGGAILIHVPNGEGLFGTSVLYGDFTHQLAFTRHSISQVGLACGFSTVDCAEDKPILHGAKSAIRVVLWVFIRSMLRLMAGAETGDTGRNAIFSRNLVAVVRK